MGRKTKHEKNPKPKDYSEESENELAQRILEGHLYSCDKCRRTNTGNHLFTKIYQYWVEPPAYGWYCAQCTRLYNDWQSNQMWKVPMTPTTPAASASSHAAAAELACASSHAAAAEPACASDWLGRDPYSVNKPIPDQEEDAELMDKPETEPKTEPDNKKDKDKKP